jgi:hypothetical protein
MKRQTIGMLSSYDGLDQADWLWKQTPHPFGIWGDVQLQGTARHPDYLLLYQFDFYRWLDPGPLSRPERLLRRLRGTAPSPPPDPLPLLPRCFSMCPRTGFGFYCGNLPCRR